jgi:ABC-type uncharacterized transport system substrate-binding protein
MEIAMKTILAVAVGTKADLSINSTQYPDLVRPYIGGLIDGLKGKGHTIGADYVIEYRQRTVDDLGFDTFDGSFSAIFCMSTTVVRAAQSITSGIPIVGIVSDPHEEGFDGVDNICGVTANRFQTADTCLKHFLQSVPSLTDLQVLHNRNNRPSQHAHDTAKKVADAHHPPIGWHVVPATSPHEVLHQLKNLPSKGAGNPPTTGIFVLPVDVNFSAASHIIAEQNASGLPAWFPTPDWVTQGAFGGYGALQYTCGKDMAERVDYAWKNGVSLPNPRWKSVADSAFELFVNGRTAASLKIPLDGISKNHIK